MSDTPVQVPRIRNALLLCAVVAVFVALGDLAAHENGDSLVPALTSLYRWTPYYWESNRYGMLVPLLASPFEHPLINLLVQHGLTSFAGLAAFFLLPRYLLGGRAWLLLGALGAGSFMLLVSPALQFEYFYNQSYGTGLALGLGALLLLDGGAAGPARARLAAGAALLLAGFWTNVACALLLGPLVVMRGLTEPVPLRMRLRHALTSLPTTAIFAAFWVNVVLMLLATYNDQTAMASLPPAQWPAAWWRLLVQAWEAVGAGRAGVVLGALLCAGGLLAVLPRTRGAASRSQRLALVLALAGVAYFLLAGITSHVSSNLGLPRYTLPALVAWALAAFVLVVPALLALPRSSGRVAASALVAVSGLTYGAPSAARVRALLESKWGSYTAEVLSTKATHVAGNYWTVWPVVFYANLQRYEAGDREPIWGVSHRAAPTGERWRAVAPEITAIAIPNGDAHGLQYLARYGYGTDLLPAWRGRFVTVLRPRDSGAQFMPLSRATFPGSLE